MNVRMRCCIKNNDKKIIRMKIKDIINLLSTAKERVFLAYRIYNSSSEIRAAIKEYKEFDELPVLTVRVKNSAGNYVDITSKELKVLYGFKDLQALLMIGDIKKAQADGNMEELDTLLSFLVNGQHVIEDETRRSIDVIKENIRKNNPGVWNEYQKICEREAQKLKDIETNYEQMIETEL